MYLTAHTVSKLPITTSPSHLSTYFLYFCKSIIHHPAPPIPATTAKTYAPAHPQPSAYPSPPAAVTTSATVNPTCSPQLKCFTYLLNTGNSPKTWMLNSIKLNTWVVLGSLDASTTAAVIATLVEDGAGNLRSIPEP